MAQNDLAGMVGGYWVQRWSNYPDQAGISTGPRGKRIGSVNQDGAGRLHVFLESQYLDDWLWGRHEVETCDAGIRLVLAIDAVARSGGDYGAMIDALTELRDQRAQEAAQP